MTEYCFQHVTTRTHLVVYADTPEQANDRLRYVTDGHTASWDEAEMPEFFQDGDRVYDHRTGYIYDARDGIPDVPHRTTQTPHQEIAP